MEGVELMSKWISVKERLPERGKRVKVLVEGKEYGATLFHNDWHFSEESQIQLGIETMADEYKYGTKIEGWHE